MPPDDVVTRGCPRVGEGIPRTVDFGDEVAVRDRDAATLGFADGDVHATNATRKAAAIRRRCVCVLSHPNALRALIGLALG